MSIGRCETPAVAYLVTRDGRTVAGPKPCVLVSRAGQNGLVIEVRDGIEFVTEDSGPTAVAIYSEETGQRLCEWRFFAERGGKVRLHPEGDR